MNTIYYKRPENSLRKSRYASSNVIPDCQLMPLSVTNFGWNINDFRSIWQRVNESQSSFIQFQRYVLLPGVSGIQTEKDAFWFGIGFNRQIKRKVFGNFLMKRLMKRKQKVRSRTNLPSIGASARHSDEGRRRRLEISFFAYCQSIDGS